jgi:hypothetical protein
MLAAGGVFLLGAALTALGVVEQLMYDIGIMVMFIGLVGIAVRSVELLRWLKD